MIHFSKFASPRQLPTASLSVLVAGLVLVSAASAVELDFNVANGNFNTAGNWVDTTDPITVPAAAAPTLGDTAYVRNGGIVTIDSDVAATEIRIGARRSITNPDYDDNGVVDAGDYVLWRKGSTPLANDSTPDSVGPEDYAFWRLRYGALTAENDIGGPGTLNWTAGEISGPVFGTHIGGPVLKVGRHLNPSPTQAEYDFPGIVTQNGPTTKILLFAPESKLNIGDEGTTPTPLNSYNLIDGTIGLTSGVGAIEGANGNDGIAVKNGTFTMLGGQIINVTTHDPNFDTLSAQRFITIGNQSGNPSGAPGTENYASATFTGGVVDVWGGIRIAPSSNSRGYLNINGPITMTTGGDTSIGYHATNGVGEMNMSAGTLNVGRTGIADVDSNGNPRINGLIGRFQVGHRGRGTLNMSDGTINVSREIRVGAEYAAGGSVINMTGGSIIAPFMQMSVTNDDPLAPGYAGSTIILDGPSAYFETGSSGTVMSYQGKGTFEVRQGWAFLGKGGGATQVGHRATSESIINVMGGKLTLGGTLLRTNPTSVAPVINLTGGTLEWNNTTTTAAQAFQADLTNDGTTLVPKPNALLQVTVGRRENITPPLPALPNNFEMTSGSWDIDVDSTIATTLGADWFNAPAGTASLTGGTLNINFLAGTPSDLQAFRILRGGLGTTLGPLGSVNISGAGAGHWELKEVPFSGTINPLYPNDEEIQLIYHTAPFPGSGAGLGVATVPEPSSVALELFAVVGFFSTAGRRKRTGARQN